MRNSHPSFATPQVVTQPRRNHPGALVIFLVAYLGILAVIFAPEGALNTPHSAQTDRR
jgi:hypothetical protein